jgi:hypothetical protein
MRLRQPPYRTKTTSGNSLSLWEAAAAKLIVAKAYRDAQNAALQSDPEGLPVPSSSPVFGMSAVQHPAPGKEKPRRNGAK